LLSGTGVEESPSRPGTDGQSRVAAKQTRGYPDSATGYDGERRPPLPVLKAGRQTRRMRHRRSENRSPSRSSWPRPSASACADKLVDARLGVTGTRRRTHGLSRRPSIAMFILPVTVERGSTIHERLRGHTHGFPRFDGRDGEFDGSLGACRQPIAMPPIPVVETVGRSRSCLWLLSKWSARRSRRRSFLYRPARCCRALGWPPRLRRRTCVTKCS
jgi:hypothetical protein